MEEQRDPRDEPGDDAVLREDREHLAELARVRRGRVIRVLSLLALVVIFIVFIIRNSRLVQIDYVFFTRESRLIWVMLACGLIGGIVGFFAGRPGRRMRFHRDRGEDRRRNGGNG